jgi:hypothetical protein
MDEVLRKRHRSQLTPSPSRRGKAYPRRPGSRPNANPVPLSPFSRLACEPFPPTDEPLVMPRSSIQRNRICTFVPRRGPLQIAIWLCGHGRVAG